MTPSSVNIHVLCLNPALDVTYHVKKLIPDQKSRSDAARHDPGVMVSILAGLCFVWEWMQLLIV